MIWLNWFQILRKWSWKIRKPLWIRQGFVKTALNQLWEGLVEKLELLRNKDRLEPKSRRVMHHLRWLVLLRWREIHEITWNRSYYVAKWWWMMVYVGKSCNWWLEVNRRRNRKTTGEVTMAVIERGWTGVKHPWRFPNWVRNSNFLGKPVDNMMMMTLDTNSTWEMRIEHKDRQWKLKTKEKNEGERTEHFF